jgi:cation transport ATPase
VAALHGLGLRCVLISGDHRAAAEAVANRLGIDEVHAEVLPEDKARLVTQLRAQGRTGMVGDGSTTRPRWPRPMWALRCPPAPTWRWRLRPSR